MMIAPLAGVTPLKPTLQRYHYQVFNHVERYRSNEIEGNGVEGNLCIKFPWPSMLRNLG